MFKSKYSKIIFSIICALAITISLCPNIVHADDPAGPGIAGAGNFNVNFVDTSGKTPSPEIELRFYDSSDSLLQTVNINAQIDDTSIPIGTKAFELQINNAADVPYLKQARMEVSITDNGERIRDTAMEKGFDDELREPSNTPEGDIYFTRYDIDDGIDMSDFGLMLSFEFSNTKNMSWSYDESYRGTDLFVENCKIYLLDSSGNRLSGTDHDLTIGNEYTFELVPDYGYQITSLTINGYPVAADASKGVFKFTMSNSNFHLGGSVAPAEDIVDASGFITNASIENGGNAAEHGNAKMTIRDAGSTDSSAIGVVDSSEHPEAVASVNIAIDEVTSKGDGNYWSENKTDLSGNVDISVYVDKNGLSNGQTYSIVREHNGTREELDAVYNITTQKLTFASSKFSTYTIIKKDGTSDDTENKNTDPKAPVKKPITLSTKNGKVSATITLETKDAKGNVLPTIDMSNAITIKGNKVVFANAKNMPTVTGYTFKGWYNGNKKVSSIAANKLKDMTVSATYTENMYSIQYKVVKPKGSKILGKIKNQSKIKYNDKLNLASGLTAQIKANVKKGTPEVNYELLGWTTVKNGTNVEYLPGQEVTQLKGQTNKDKKIVLYSVWKEVNN